MFPASRRRARVPFHVLIALVALGATIGCGGPPRPDYSSLGLTDVYGTVTLDGEPLEGAEVRFYTVGDRSRYSYGRTDSDGVYVLNYDSNAEGVKPGPKEIFISTSAGGANDPETGGPELVPSRYNKQSTLTATVEPGGSQTFDFDLTSEGEIEAFDPSAEDEEP